VSLYQSGVGSLLHPFREQLQKVDEMRKDTLNRVDATSRKVSTAVIASAVISAVSTAVLVKSAHDMKRGRG